MKIIVLNGSPKGKASVTMQYVNYIQKKFPQHELKILDIAKKIKWIEKDKSEDYFIKRIKSGEEGAYVIIKKKGGKVFIFSDDEDGTIIEKKINIMKVKEEGEKIEVIIKIEEGKEKKEGKEKEIEKVIKKKKEKK